MIVLVLSVCLAADPDRCKDVNLTFSADGLTPYECVMRAQPELAKWIGEHPGWQVKKWRCAYPEQLAKNI